MSESLPPERYASYTWHIISQLGHIREGRDAFPITQLRLVQKLDTILDLFDTDPDFHFLTLDGQSILIEDYLALRPENFERVEERVQEGRLLLGPWYICPEPAFVSSEALIRNLMMGLRTARVFGPPLMVSYMPEVVGIPGELPQILSSFGITQAIVQNESPQPVERRWQGSDGTAILLSQLTQQDRSESGHLMVINNWQADRPWQTVEDMLRVGLERPDKILNSSPVAYAKALDTYSQTHEMPVFRGDLRNYTGVRPIEDVKRVNDKSEHILAHWVEPLYVWADSLETHNNEAHVRRPQVLLQKLWRSLMENQTPYILAGQVSEEVIREIQIRCDRILLTADTLIAAATADIARHTHDDSLQLPKDQPISALLVTSSEPAFRIDAVKLPEDSDKTGMIVRGYNTTGDDLWITLTPWRTFQVVETVKLDETQTGGTLAVEANGAIYFKAGPYRILTFWFHD